MQGLNNIQIADRQRRYGLNKLPEEKKFSGFSIFISQFANPLAYVLYFAIVISALFGEFADVALIAVVVLINGCLGFYQEYRAQKTLELLKKLVKPVVIVIRGGHRQEIESETLVPEDLVLIGSGDQVPADGELTSGEVTVNEAILTGESELIEKKESHEKSLFMGTTVISGSGILRVTKIGLETEIGKIGKSLENIEEEQTPLQKKLTAFSKNLAYLTIILCVIIFVVGILFGQEFFNMLRVAVILSVAAIPEGLPMAATIVMALGMKRVLEKKGLVRKLNSIETLGSTSVICTDKTGTLTEGKMRVVKSELVDRQKALEIMVLNNNQKSNIEIVLMDYVENNSTLDPQAFRDETKRIGHDSFSSEKKYSITRCLLADKETALMMGAPEIIINFCKKNDKFKTDLIKKINRYAGEGYHLLGFCYKEQGDLKVLENYIWAGLLCLEDPVRPDVAESIRLAKKAGIEVKIVTGDYLKTAESVAKRLGIASEPSNVLEGEELEKMSEADLAKIIDGITIFARVTPNQKLKIVLALKEKGEVVAMTGDGVNDAPALKKADIGVVVQSGSDVSKEVADLVLLDANFNTIVAAVEEGRVVFDNIKKVIAYVLSNAFADIVLIFGAIIFALPVPLTILQILWIHVICDGPPDIALAFEPKDKKLMQERPKKIQQEEVIGHKVKILVAFISIVTGSFALLSFYLFYKISNDIVLGRTIAFVILSIVSLVYVFSFKNLERPVYKLSQLFNNKYLNWSLVYGFVLLLLAVYLPGLNNLLQTKPLKMIEWLYVIAFSLILTVAIQFSLMLANKKTAKRVLAKPKLP